MTAPFGSGTARPLRGRLAAPTLPELWAFLAVALPVLGALIATLPTVDLTYQLRAGGQILDGAGIPAADTWTFTALGRPWLDQQWAAQVLLALTWRLGGWTGLAILRAALVGVIAWGVFAAIGRRAPGWPARNRALLTLAAYIVMAPALALRPQLFGMVLFALSLLILSVRRERPALLWVLPVIAVAWANLHGSFVLAPLLVGLAWFEDAADRAPRAGRTLLAAVLTGAATAVTPFGVGVWGYALGLAGNRDVVQRVSEWQPPGLTDIPGILFWISVVLAFAVAIGVARRPGRRFPWPAFVALTVFAGLGAVSGRGAAWWPMVAVVTVAGLLVAHSAPAAGRAVVGRRLNAVLAVALTLAGLALLPLWRPVDAGLGAPSGVLSYAPSGITATLRSIATPADRIWNPQVWGSWFEFAVPAPAYALDSRIEVIPSATWSDAEVVATAAAGWSDVLDAARVTIVVTKGATADPLAGALAASPAWTRLLADADGTVWQRSAP